MSRPLHVCYLCSEYPPAPHGGIGTYVQTMARALVAAGQRVTVAGFGPEDTAWEDEGVRVRILRETHVPRLSWWLDRRRLGRWLRREATATGISVVEDSDFRAHLPFAFEPAPVVMRLHLSESAVGPYMGRRIRRSTRWCERAALARHRQWIGVSQFALDDTRRFFGLAPAGARILYTPIVAPNGSPELTWHPPENFVLFAGLVGVRKGTYVAAEAANEFLREYPDLHFLIVGKVDVEDGVPADQRIRAIVAPELQARVHILGRAERRAQVWTLMRRARAFLFPSGQEFFGLAGAEAMLAGCPLIMGDACAAREFVVPDRTGLLVPPGDAVALAAAVRRVLADPAAARELGRRAAESVQQRFALGPAVAANLAAFSALATTGRL